MAAPIGDTPVGVDYEPDAETPTRAVEEVMRRHEDRLLRLPGVTGVGIGQDAVGNAAIVVYLREGSAASRLPGRLDDFDVVFEVTGDIDAY